MAPDTDVRDTFEELVTFVPAERVRKVSSPREVLQTAADDVTRSWSSHMMRLEEDLQTRLDALTAEVARTNAEVKRLRDEAEALKMAPVHDLYASALAALRGE